jgi:hypothetical protein
MKTGSQRSPPYHQVLTPSDTINTQTNCTISIEIVSALAVPFVGLGAVRGDGMGGHCNIQLKAERSIVPLYGKSHKIGNCELVDPSFLRAFASRRNGVLGFRRARSARAKNEASISFCPKKGAQLETNTSLFCISGSFAKTHSVPFCPILSRTIWAASNRG